MTPRGKAKPHGADRKGQAQATPGHVGQTARWPLLLIGAAGIAVYANALGHPFIFDDTGAIVENPTIRSLVTSLAGGPVQSPTAGRPVVNVSFALNYLVGGVTPWGYHATNLAIHIASAMLLFGLLRRVFLLPLMRDRMSGVGTGAAASIALLWVVHPLTSEIVNYATQRTEGLMALAFLGTLYAGVRALQAAHPRRWQVMSVAACAAGTACKESMVTAPFLMLLLDATFSGAGLGAAVRRRPGYYTALFATWLLLALLIVEGPRWRSAGFTSGVSPWTYLLNQAPMITRYLRLIVWPTGLVLDYGEPVSRTLLDVWPSAALVVLLLLAAMAAWRVAPVTAFLSTWFFVTLAPTSSFVPIATEVGAERRMYLPLVAVLALLVLAAGQMFTRVPARIRLRSAMAALALGCTLLGIATLARNAEYDTPLGIWQTVVERRPSGRAHHMVGMELKAVGRRDEAIREYRLAIETSPEAHYALGFELGADSRHQEAVEHYRAFIRLRPGDAHVPRAYHQIGRSLMALGQHDEAAAAFREVLTRKPGDADSLAGLADTLVALERWADAAIVYTDFLRIRPTDPDARFNMGLALVRLDRDAEARELFASVVQLQPGNVAAHVNYAYALANTGRYGDSVREFRKAAELEKDPAARAEIEGAIAELLGNH